MKNEEKTPEPFDFEAFLATSYNMSKFSRIVIKVAIIALFLGTAQLQANTDNALWSPDVDWMLNPVLVA